MKITVRQLRKLIREEVESAVGSKDALDWEPLGHQNIPGPGARKLMVKLADYLLEGPDNEFESDYYGDTKENVMIRYLESANTGVVTTDDGDQYFVVEMDDPTGPYNAGSDAIGAHKMVNGDVPLSEEVTGGLSFKDLEDLVGSNAIYDSLQGKSPTTV